MKHCSIVIVFEGSRNQNNAIPVALGIAAHCNVHLSDDSGRKGAKKNQVKI